MKQKVHKALPKEHFFNFIFLLEKRSLHCFFDKYHLFSKTSNVSAGVQIMVCSDKVKNTLFSLSALLRL